MILRCSGLIYLTLLNFIQLNTSISPRYRL
jgi:hypothetical protein